MRKMGRDTVVHAPHYLREWRQYRRLTQAAASERTDLSETRISRLENYQEDYTQGNLHAFAHAYNCEPADLLSQPPSADRPEDDLTRHLKKLRTAEDRARAARIIAAAFNFEKVG